MPDIQLPSTSKSWLSRPDGKAGLIPPIIACVVGFYFWGVISDFVVNAVDNFVHLLIVGGFAAAILWMIFDPKFRTFFFYLYKSLMRWVTAKFIDMDPIGVLKTYKERLEGKLGEMDTSISALGAQREKVERIIRGNEKKIDASMGLVQQAAKKGDTRIEQTEGKQARRLGDQNERLGVDFKRIQFLMTVLNKYRELSADTILDMTREIEVRKVEADYSKASRNVVRSAMGILKGLPEKEFYDEGIDALERQYTEAIGEVDHFLEITKDIMAKSDLEGSMDADKAMSMLNAWQAKNSTVVIGGTSKGETKSDIIQNAAKEIAASPGVALNPLSASTRPNYEPAKSSGGDDDYLKAIHGK